MAMNKLLVFVIVAFSAQFASADMIRVECKNTKIKWAKNILLDNSSDFGKSGKTGPKSDWSLKINNKNVQEARVKVLGSESNVTGFNIDLKTGKALSIVIGKDGEKAFAFDRVDGEKVRATASYCSMDID